MKTTENTEGTELRPGETAEAWTRRMRGLFEQRLEEERQASRRLKINWKQRLITNTRRRRRASRVIEPNIQG